MGEPMMLGMLKGTKDLRLERKGGKKQSIYCSRAGGRDPL